jgi:hypothetical protein
MGASTHRDRTRYGTIHVEELGETHFTSRRDPTQTIPVSQSLYIWTPPSTIEDHLYLGFRQEFTCITGRDGVRQFIPSKNVGCLQIEGALGGYALLHGDRKLSNRQRSRYPILRMIYHQGSHLREYLTRNFTRKQDLYITPVVRLGQDDAHILPADLGQDAQYQGTPWGPEELLKQGREKATAAGIREPTEAECIRLGLLEAALRNPLYPKGLKKAQARSLVRLALFDVGPAPKPPKKMIQIIYDRLVTALERHLDDETCTFDSWFYDHVDNLVHLIAKRKGEGGPIPRETVRQALLEIVFEAYASVGHCLHVQMRAFREALPVRLNRQELKLFNAVYQNQAYLGDLPLLLLLERFDFLNQAVVETRAHPGDPKWIGALLRLLYFYGEMTSKRRQADQRYKRQHQYRNQKNKSAQVLEVDPDRDEAPKREANLFQQIAGELREQRKARCSCGSWQFWWAELPEGDDHLEKEEIIFEDTCSMCGASEEVTVSRQEFKEIGFRLQRREGNHSA